MNPVNPNEKLPYIRKYFFEYIVVTLVFAVGFLFKEFNDLNKYIRENYEQLVLKTNEQMYKSTNATEQFLNNQKYNK